MLKVFHNRRHKPAESLFQKAFWIPWLSFQHCNYQTARATDTANWLFTSKAARCWSYRVNTGALGSSCFGQRAWSSSQPPLGKWETYQPFLCVDGHSAVQSYQLHFQCPSFCDHHSLFPDSGLTECFPVPCVLKNKARSLLVFLAWCLLPLAASSVWQSHSSQH